MLTALFIVGCIFAWMLVGAFFGQLSWWVWHEKKTKGFLAYFLFPVSYLNGDIGKSNKNDERLVASLEKNSYLVAMAFVWPVKFVWGMILLVIGVSFLIIKLIVNAAVNVARWTTKMGVEEDNPLEEKAVEEVVLLNHRYVLDGLQHIKTELVKLDIQQNELNTQRQVLLSRKAEIEENPELGKVLKLQGERPCA